MSALSDLRESRELVVNLTLREIRGKYKRTVLGQTWSLVNPLAAMLIYTVVFRYLLRVEPEAGQPSGLNVFALWLMCGLLPWTFFNSVVNAGMSSLVNDANLIKKVWFPREAVVISASLSWLFSHVIEMVVLAIVLTLFGAFVLPWLPLVALAILLLLAFGVGVALMLAIANVYFRDTQHFVGIGMQMWFYLTPVLYPVAYVETQAEKLASAGSSFPLLTLYRLNPMERFVQVFRSLLYDNTWPAVSDVIFCTVVSVTSLGLGYWVFKRYEARIAEEL